MSDTGTGSSSDDDRDGCSDCAEGGEGVGRLLEEIVEGQGGPQVDPVDVLVCL